MPRERTELSMYYIYYADYHRGGHEHQPKRLPSPPHLGQSDFIVWPQAAGQRGTLREAVSFGLSTSRPFVITDTDGKVEYAEGFCVRGFDFDREADNSEGRVRAAVDSDRARATLPSLGEITLTVRNAHGTPAVFCGELFVAYLTDQQTSLLFSKILGRSNERPGADSVNAGGNLPLA